MAIARVVTQHETDKFESSDFCGTREMGASKQARASGRVNQFARYEATHGEDLLHGGVRIFPIGITGDLQGVGSHRNIVTMGTHENRRRVVNACTKQ